MWINLKKYSTKLLLFFVIISFILLNHNNIVKIFVLSDTCEYIEDDKIAENVEAAPNTNHGISSCPLTLTNTKENFLTPTYVEDYNETEYAYNLNIKLGGCWKPSFCESRHHVAIIVPYRNRIKQLETFLYYIHPFLQKQLINYRIFIIEQTNNKPFNRGKLMNIGYTEAMKITKFHCFIFHDVDLIPEVYANVYGCTKKPRHMSSSIDVWGYKLLYSGAFGGVSAIQQKHFELINGYSNVYFGWGGEDDDLLARLDASQLHICRFSNLVSRYTMLDHLGEHKNPGRWNLLKEASSRFTTDGLNSLLYVKLSQNNTSLSTHITVDI